MSDLISRTDAIEELDIYFEHIKIIDKRGLKRIEPISRDVKGIIDTLPSAEAEQTDCTDFVNWLTEKVMDEEMWELNAVAYGEIICRKLVKLGVLEVTEEPSYYIRPSSEADTVEMVRYDIAKWRTWSHTYDNARIDGERSERMDKEIVTYCMIYECEECPKYGDECGGRDE